VVSQHDQVEIEHRMVENAPDVLGTARCMS